MNSTSRLGGWKWLVVLIFMASASGLLAAAGYRQINLVSDGTNAAFADPALLNPWGIYVDRAGGLVVANNHSTAVATYRSSGKPISPRFMVVAPIDVAANYGRSYVITNGSKARPSTLLIATETGTIEGWNAHIDPSNSVVAIDNSGAGASYKGLALGGARYQATLYAANFHQGIIDMFDGRFQFVKSFTDTNLMTNGFAPFGIRNIGGKLFVAFAKQHAPDNEDEEAGPGLGYVDVFDLNGNLVKRLTSGGTLNAPWGLALAPKGFGHFGGALLVGNFGDGTINAFDADTGDFLGQLKDTDDNVIQIDGLWGLAFRGNTLYFAAGPEDELHGLVGALKWARGH